MPKKVCLITGATSGLGKELALKLSKLNYNLILVGNNKNKLKNLKKFFDLNNHSFYNVNLANLGNIKKFLNKIKKIKKIDLVINNAGSLIYENKTIKNSKSIKVNYLSHVYLTEKLIKKIKKSKDRKVIFISSHVHENIYLNNNIFIEKKKYNSWELYKLSKLFLTTYANYLNKKNLKIDVYAINPGRLSSDFKLENYKFVSYLIKYYLYIFGKSLKKISTKILKLILVDRNNKKKIYYNIDKESYPHHICNNKEFQEKLWNFSKTNFTHL